eukprot:TRINITY_DN2869_c2_g3_i1.p1 TRINITY_DN2869_c2_g3~~TRINITY_DN2869_c2_g3_i1.p1  ORF type:complete len:1310 (-),score=212.44 TRINITY_DN2869_c2_g3_i1:116-4045(-)
MEMEPTNMDPPTIIDEPSTSSGPSQIKQRKTDNLVSPALQSAPRRTYTPSYGAGAKRTSYKSSSSSSNKPLVSFQYNLRILCLFLPTLLILLAFGGKPLIYTIIIGFLTLYTFHISSVPIASFLLLWIFLVVSEVILIVSSFFLLRLNILNVFLLFSFAFYILQIGIWGALNYASLLLPFTELKPLQALERMLMITFPMCCTTVFVYMLYLIHDGVAYLPFYLVFILSYILYFFVLPLPSSFSKNNIMYLQTLGRSSSTSDPNNNNSVSGDSITRDPKFHVVLVMGKKEMNIFLFVAFLLPSIWYSVIYHRVVFRDFSYFSNLILIFNLSFILLKVILYKYENGKKDERNTIPIKLEDQFSGIFKSIFLNLNNNNAKNFVVFFTSAVTFFSILNYKFLSNNFHFIQSSNLVFLKALGFTFNFIFISIPVYILLFIFALHVSGVLQRVPRIIFHVVLNFSFFFIFRVLNFSFYTIPIEVACAILFVRFYFKRKIRDFFFFVAGFSALFGYFLVKNFWFLSFYFWNSNYQLTMGFDSSNYNIMFLNPVLMFLSYFDVYNIGIFNYNQISIQSLIVLLVFNFALAMLIPGIIILKLPKSVVGVFMTIQFSAFTIAEYYLFLYSYEYDNKVYPVYLLFVTGALQFTLLYNLYKSKKLSFTYVWILLCMTIAKNGLFFTPVFSPVISNFFLLISITLPFTLKHVILKNMFNKLPNTSSLSNPNLGMAKPSGTSTLSTEYTKDKFIQNLILIFFIGVVSYNSRYGIVYRLLIMYYGALPTDSVLAGVWLSVFLISILPISLNIAGFGAVDSDLFFSAAMNRSSGVNSTVAAKARIEEKQFERWHRFMKNLNIVSLLLVVVYFWVLNLGFEVGSVGGLLMATNMKTLRESILARNAALNPGTKQSAQGFDVSFVMNIRYAKIFMFIGIIFNFTVVVFGRFPMSRARNTFKLLYSLITGFCLGNFIFNFFLPFHQIPDFNVYLTSANSFYTFYFIFIGLFVSQIYSLLLILFPGTLRSDRAQFSLFTALFFINGFAYFILYEEVNFFFNYSFIDSVLGAFTQQQQQLLTHSFNKFETLQLVSQFKIILFALALLYCLFITFLCLYRTKSLFSKRTVASSTSSSSSTSNLKPDPLMTIANTTTTFAFLCAVVINIKYLQGTVLSLIPLSALLLLIDRDQILFRFLNESNRYFAPVFAIVVGWLLNSILYLYKTIGAKILTNGDKRLAENSWIGLLWNFILLVSVVPSVCGLLAFLTDYKKREKNVILARPWVLIPLNIVTLLFAWSWSTTGLGALAIGGAILQWVIRSRIARQGLEII